MKRFLAGTAAILAAVLFLSCPVSALSAQKAILMDGETGRVIYEKRADEKSLIASTTKIMTAILICEQCNVLDRMRIPKEAVGIEGSSIYLKAMENGLLKIFVEAGCVVSTPTCGPCLGGYMGILAAGERAVATTNRNFIGRMGDVTSEVYLASPAVAAASAIAGKIADPRN